MSLVILSGNHYIGADVTVEYYDNFGNNVPITGDVIWFGGDTVSDITTEIERFRNKTSVQLLNPLPNYLRVHINNDYSDIFMINRSQAIPTQSETLPTVGSGISMDLPVSMMSGLSTETTNIGRINQSYRLILSTAKGEYPMLPNLGCNLYKFQFRTIFDDSDLENIKQDLLSDLLNQEPRGNIESLDIAFDYVDTLLIRITYSIYNTNITGNVIYNQKVGGEVNG